LAVDWYNNLKNIAYFWYDKIASIIGVADDLLYLSIQIIDKIKSLFSSEFVDQLLEFLANPGAWIWAFIIGLAEEKLEELLDNYW